jgi:copper chaperone
MIELEITGMSCQHCVSAVTEALEGVVGVVRVEVNRESGQALVEGQSEPAALLAAVETAGYGARLVST